MQLYKKLLNKYLYDIENVLNFSNYLNSFSAVCCGPVSAKELSTQALQGVLPGVRKSCSGLVKLAGSHRDQYSQIYINKSLTIRAKAKFFQQEHASLISPSYKVLNPNNECL